MPPDNQALTPQCVAEPIAAPGDEHVLASEPAPLTLADVPRLLAQSRAHALNRKRFANQQTNKQHTPNLTAAESEAAVALSTRLQAHDLDPDHADPSWALDVVPHAEIVAFLTAYPAIP